ncbi:MAG TPA: PH domain-containing protein [Bryobacteraceae bacterium]|nr:PH domain-containing protein [Bryobacteraceae bacterium]
MSDLTIRPTLKFIKAGAILAAAVFLGLEILYLTRFRCCGYPSGAAWLMALPPLVLLWPLERWVRRQSRKATVSGERLRYECGVLSKTTRNIQLSKLQDARVEQRLLQRLVGVGDLSLETAGEASRLTIPNVDDPQALADEIMSRAQAGAGSGHGV